MTASQTWNPADYARHARFVAELGAPVLTLLEPRPGERVLDLGCGDGVLTKALADLGCEVVGVDDSAEQVEAARRLGVDARVMSGASLEFDGEFDAVFSNAAVHWMKPPGAVVSGVRRALRPSGRFVAEFGGEGCVATIRRALFAALERRGIDAAPLDPWYFPGAAEYTALLGGSGFRVDSLEVFPRPTPLPTDVAGWLRTFGGPFLAPLAESERAGFIDEVALTLRPALCDPTGQWVADYVRLRFMATLTT